MSNNHNEPKTETIAETDNFMAWNFFDEEWNEFLQLVRSLR